MARIKRGVTAHRRHRKVLRQTKGHYGTKNRLFKRANESLMRALAFQYRDRRTKKRDMRRLWIQRINAGARLHGFSYSQFMGLIKKAEIELNRKVLADLAMNHPEAFKAVVERVK
mgnify:CR=1 FL=1